MDEAAKLAVFKAQVTNVRATLAAQRQVARSINSALRSNNTPAIEHFTKLYALLFCAWAEANFSKVLHTPFGFDLSEIAQVQTAKREGGIVVAWKKCVELGLRHLDAKRGSFRPNARKKLEAAIDTHVFEPSLLRNKLAHGQWAIALNRGNDAVQPDLTHEIGDLDIVKIGSWITGHALLATLVEHLIESPKKAFMRNWDEYAQRLEAQLVTAATRTLQEHKARLLDKDQRTGAREKRQAIP